MGFITTIMMFLTMRRMPKGYKFLPATTALLISQEKHRPLILLAYLAVATIQMPEDMLLKDNMKMIATLTIMTISSVQSPLT